MSQCTNPNTLDCSDERVTLALPYAPIMLPPPPVGFRFLATVSLSGGLANRPPLPQSLNAESTSHVPHVSNIRCNLVSFRGVSLHLFFCLSERRISEMSVLPSMLGSSVLPFVAALSAVYSRFLCRFSALICLAALVPGFKH